MKINFEINFDILRSGFEVITNYLIISYLIISVVYTSLVVIKFLFPFLLWNLITELKENTKITGKEL